MKRGKKGAFLKCLFLSNCVQSVHCEYFSVTAKDQKTHFQSEGQKIQKIRLPVTEADTELLILQLSNKRCTNRNE